MQISSGLHCGCQSQCSQLGHCKKNGEKDILTDTTVPRCLGPKRARESANFSTSLKKIVSANRL